MDSKELCLRILRAESEAEVDSIVRSNLDLSGSENWYPIDGRETNYNVVTNQASTGSKALTELCTNMVDAILMKHAHLKGINLTGPEAPQSVIAAVRDLVALRGSRSGILAEIDDPRYLQEFAEENLVIGVTGGTRREESICFTFVDNGEGQHAADFEDTFLSLSKGNKSSIPFVQGKYNMGASGVLTYCGERWYKLIISRRYDESGPWGWTLVRRRPGQGMPVAEYFKPRGGVLVFDSPILYPMNLRNREQDPKVHVSAGTVVKLYDYHMESAASFRNIRESLNENLVSTVLPFRLMDYRYPPDQRRGGRRAQGIDERPVNGMEFLLLRREDDASEEEYQPGEEQYIGELDHPKLGHIAVRAVVLPKTLPGWLKSPRNVSRVFHAVNGQVQHKQNRAYVSQACGFPGLKDRVVIIVDSSELFESAHNNIWKGDRETIRRTSIGQLYIDELTSIIKGSEYLKELQQRITREELESLAEEGQTKLFQNLLDTDPNIAQLLPSGATVSLRGNTRPSITPTPYQGKYSPTLLETIGRTIKDNGAEIAIDGKRTIAFTTDVVDNYFLRPDNRGRVFFTGGISTKFSYRRSLREGRLTMELEAIPSQVNVGEELDFQVCLIDDAMPEPVMENVKIKVVAQRVPQRSGSHTPRSREEDAEGEDSSEIGRGLPASKWLTKDGRSVGDEPTEVWSEYFTDQDGGIVDDLGENQRVYKINYDNAHFRYFLEHERNDINKKVVVEQYRIGMLVLMMGLEDAYSRMEQLDIKSALGENIEDIRRLAARGAATVVMSIAKTLPTIVNPSSVADADDD